MSLWPKQMRDIFKDRALQKEFERKGYVEMPLLDGKEISLLYNIFLQHENEYNQPFHTSHFSNEESYKRDVNDTIIKVVFPKLTGVLNNCVPILGNLMVKQGASDYFMPLHADWTYVNEEEYRSIAVWIPLVDTNEINGCLGVIEGTHKISNKIRGAQIHQTGYIRDKEWVKKHGKLLPTTAGHAIIYDHALMHYSPPNTTPNARPALNLSVVPAEAGIIHYCIPDGTSEIEVYSVDNSDFFLSYNNGQRPRINSLIKTLPAETVKWVDEKMESFDPGRKKNFLARIFG